MPEAVSSCTDPFPKPQDLIGYIRIHGETPRALISVKHLVEACYLAGWKLDGVTKKYYEETKDFQTLHDYDWKALCTDANRRIAEGVITLEWKRELRESLS